MRLGLGFGHPKLAERQKGEPHHETGHEARHHHCRHGLVCVVAFLLRAAVGADDLVRVGVGVRVRVVRVGSGLGLEVVLGQRTFRPIHEIGRAS